VELRDAIWALLGYGALPAWLLAGGADWLCHRRSRIELTSGPVESAMHVVLFLQIAIPVLLGLWFAINALLLTFMAVGVLAHMVTSWWDTRYSEPRRLISPFEQQIHGWLVMWPIFALLLVALLHADELATPQWRLVSRENAPSLGWRCAVLLGLATGFALILEEWWRGWRHGHGGPPN
jgi:hypothetical protein